MRRRLTILLDELIKQLPPDTEARVEAAKNRLNASIRDGLRKETALRLNRQGRDSENIQSRRSPTEFINVPIRILPGKPEEFEDREMSEDEWLAFYLARWRAPLERLKNSSAQVQDLARFLHQQGGWDTILQGRDRNLLPVQQLAEDLLNKIRDVDPVKRILSVNRDILGIYRYKLPQRDRAFGQIRDPFSAHIELYWGIIGLVAQYLDKSVEALTAVVHAHELGHAYTHLGADIDGHRWASLDFYNSDHPLKEGLSQYYTDLICRSHSEKVPQVYETYEALLERQPEAYRTHVPWTEKCSPEEVRFALIEIRRHGPGHLNTFEEALDEAHHRLQQRTGVGITAS